MKIPQYPPIAAVQGKLRLLNRVVNKRIHLNDLITLGFVPKIGTYRPCKRTRYTARHIAESARTMSITPQESRAARGLLDWNQSQLAQVALLGLSTVRNFESQLRETTTANLAAIHGAFEKAGVIFESDGKHIGVKLKIRRGK